MEERWRRGAHKGGEEIKIRSKLKRLWETEGVGKYLTGGGTPALLWHAPCTLLYDSIIIMNKTGRVFLHNAEAVCSAKSEEHQSMKSEKRSWCSSALPRLSGGSSGCDRTENTAPGPSPLPSYFLTLSCNYWTLLPHYLSLSYVTPHIFHRFYSSFCWSHISASHVCACSCIDFHF